VDCFKFSYASVDGKIILKWILNIMGNCGLDNLVQNRAKLRAVLYDVMNLRFSTKGGEFRN